MMVDVPPGYTLRRPARDELAPVAGLIAAYELAQLGEATTSAESLAQVWSLPRFVPEEDGWLMDDVHGRPAAYAGVVAWDPHVDLQGDLFVHPDHEDRGIDALLLRLLEERAREQAAPAPPGRQATLSFHVPRQDVRRRALLSAAGYAIDRSSYRMVIDLAVRPARTSPPDGIDIRPLVLGLDERAVFAAVDEAFRDHARYVPQPFEDFVQSDLENPAFDAELWLLAWSGGEVVGVAGSYDYPTGPEVNVLAVRKPWRRRGTGKALLLRSFAAFARRGRETVCLYVNAANEQNAVHLYESVGMRATQVYDCFMKDLDPV